MELTTTALYLGSMHPIRKPLLELLESYQYACKHEDIGQEYQYRLAGIGGNEGGTNVVAIDPNLITSSSSMIFGQIS